MLELALPVALETSNKVLDPKWLYGAEEFAGSLERFTIGEELVKFTGRGDCHPRHFFLSDDLSRLCWFDAKNRIKTINFSEVTRIQGGANTVCFKRRRKVHGGHALDYCTFSLILPSRKSGSLDIECRSQEQRDNWISIIRFCVENARLGGDHDVRFMCNEWDTCTKSQKTIRHILQKLNIDLTKQEIRTMYQEVISGGIGTEDVIACLHARISHRKEFDRLFDTFADLDALDNLSRLMSVESFSNFLRDEQSTEMFPDACDQVLSALLPQRLAYAPLSQSDFVRYLCSDANHPIHPDHRVVYQNMDQPISHYYIATSHNTYLEGDQLRGNSTINMYIQALHFGCRCLELDCWDGSDGEPTIYHGYTLTSRILFKDVIQAIADHAFLASTFPLILSIENHCSSKQMKAMAHYFKTIFGDHLHTRDQDPAGLEKLPSPNDLKFKILVKATDSPEFSDILYFGKQKVRAKRLHQEHFGFRDMYSYSETKISKISSVCLDNFMEKSQNQLMRCYPAARRVASSNFNPLRVWRMGGQLAAMNYQTPGKAMAINLGQFQVNGNCGYILKPLSLRCKNPSLTSAASLGDLQRLQEYSKSAESTMFSDGFSEIRVRVISACQLPKIRNKSAVIDPYVRLSLHTLRSESKQKLRTRTVSDNGFNPVWDEEFVFRVKFEDFAHLTFLVFNEDRLFENQILAGNSLPVSELRPGYRFLPLRNRRHEFVRQCGIYIHTTFSTVDSAWDHKRMHRAMRSEDNIVYSQSKLR
eukprot:419934_1